MAQIDGTETDIETHLVKKHSGVGVRIFATSKHSTYL